MTFTLAVHRGAGKDRHGFAIPGSDHDVDGCAAAPAGSTELVNGQATVITQDTVYAPYDADVAPQDTVTVPSGQPIEPGNYQVDGNPARWSNPLTGRQAGSVIRLTRAT